MIQISRLFRFIRTDVIWVATGQLVALIVGLLSLKIFTNLFAAEQYAYIALMMAMSAWIWTGLYQPLNQTIFRFYPLAIQQGWQAGFIPNVLNYEKKIAVVVLVLSAAGLVYGVVAEREASFFLLILLSASMGTIYGGVHGVVSFFLAQKKRQPVAVIQSSDGLFRLVGGLLAFYAVSQTEYATATGLVLAGLVFFIVVMVVFRKQLLFQQITHKKINEDIYLAEFKQYFNKMFVVMILNASVIHLDKWLLFALIGGVGFGKYAVVYMLAMTMTTVMYVFFEMLGFPIIFNQQNPYRRKHLLTLLLASYALCLGGVVLIINTFGEQILLFFTSQYVASEQEIFTTLMLACGLLNFGRLLMVQGQVDKQPDKYWPAYLVLLCFFVSWCLLLVGQDDGLLAAQGFAWGSVIFIAITGILNMTGKEQLKVSDV